MAVLVQIFILSFSYDLPLFSFYTKWATIKASDISGLLLILFWLLSIAFRRSKLNIPLSKQLWFYFAICTITSLQTFFFMVDSRDGFTALAYSGYWILKLIEFTLFYLIVYELTSNRIRALRFLFAFWLGGVFVSTYGLLEHYGIAPQLWGRDVLTPNAVTSTLSWHHGVLGNYIVIILFLTLGLFIRESRKRVKVILGLSLPIFIYIEMLSLRRSSWIGVLIASCLWIIFMRRNLSTKLKYYIIFATLSVLIIPGFMYSEPAKERSDVFYHVFNRHIYSDIGISDPSVETRKEVFSFFLNVSKENPLSLLWGRGFMSSPMRYEYSGAHMEFMDVLHDCGILGLGIFVWLLYSIMKILWKFSRSFNDDWQPIYYSFFFGVIGLICTGGFYSVGHVNGNFLGLFLSLLAVVIASGQKRHRNSYS